MRSPPVHQSTLHRILLDLMRCILALISNYLLQEGLQCRDEERCCLDVGIINVRAPHTQACDTLTVNPINIFSQIRRVPTVPSNVTVSTTASTTERARGPA